MKEVLLSDLLTHTLSRDSTLPLQRQIYDVIRRAVLDHTLVAGQKLPSSRALANDLSVSRITVSLAYDRLISESYVVAAGGSGTYVAQTSAKPRVIGDDPPLDGPPLSKRGKEVANGRSGLGQHAGAFVPGVADASMFPFHIWRRLTTRHLGKSDLSLAGYSRDGAGFLPLREAIASYLGISRAVSCTAQQVIITTGTHQSLDLCARMLADVGDTVMVEDPCHWGFPPVLASAGLRVAPIRVGPEGIEFAGARLPARAKLLLTSPSHQYPTGIVMPLTKRLDLLEAAGARNLWILEDDYDSEFRYDGAPIPSLQGLDDSGQVIYMGTFSKAMFPGIKMSYIVVPQRLSQAFSEACTKIYRSGSLHLQAALADFVLEGHFSQHIRRMRLIYAERQAVLRASLTEHLGGAIEASQAKAGLHIFTKLLCPVQVEDLIGEASVEGLVLGAPNFLAPRPQAQMRAVVLGYGGVNIAEIDPGVKRLARALDRAVAKARLHP